MEEKFFRNRLKLEKKINLEKKTLCQVQVAGGGGGFDEEEADGESGFEVEARSPLSRLTVKPCSI